MTDSSRTLLNTRENNILTSRLQSSAPPRAYLSSPRCQNSPDAMVRDRRRPKMGELRRRIRLWVSRGLEVSGRRKCQKRRSSVGGGERRPTRTLFTIAHGMRRAREQFIRRGEPSREPDCESRWTKRLRVGMRNSPGDVWPGWVK